MENEFIKIKSVQHLLDVLNEDATSSAEFFVQLAIGRSWKTISLEDGDKIWVLNQIDDSEEEISISDIENHLLGEAIKNGALYFAWR